MKNEPYGIGYWLNCENGEVLVSPISKGIAMSEEKTNPATTECAQEWMQRIADAGDEMVVEYVDYDRQDAFLARIRKQSPPFVWPECPVTKCFNKETNPFLPKESEGGIMLNDRTRMALERGLALSEIGKAIPSHNKLLPKESEMKTLYDYVVIEKVDATLTPAAEDPKVIKADQVWAHSSEDATRRVYQGIDDKRDFDTLEVLVRPFCS